MFFFWLNGNYFKQLVINVFNANVHNSHFSQMWLTFKYIKTTFFRLEFLCFSHRLSKQFMNNFFFKNYSSLGTRNVWILLYVAKTELHKINKHDNCLLKHLSERKQHDRRHFIGPKTFYFHLSDTLHLIAMVTAFFQTLWSIRWQN